MQPVTDTPKAGERTQREMAEETHYPFCEECGCRITAGRCKHGVGVLLVIDKNSNFTHKGGERTQHTPGPWEFEAGTGTLIIPAQRVNGRSYDDAEIYCGDLVGAWADLPEAEANARLIAAAPELLEEGKVALAQLEEIKTWHEENSGTGSYGPPLELMNAISGLVAAIAKAEGKA